MIFEQTHYRDYLKEVLAERIRQNPSYSLRAFARQLKVQPSLLSEILRGSRKLTEETAMKIADGLGLAEQERQYLRLLVQLDRAKSASLKDSVLSAIQGLHPERTPVRDLGVDLFRTIADWHHFALLRLIETEGFEWSVAAAARALGINEYEIDSALRRLERLELVRLDAQGGRPAKLTQDLLVSSQAPNEALQKYHAQMLAKAAEALKEQTPDQRFTGTEDVVLDAEQMSEARVVFEECFDRILALSRKRKGKRSEVYHLGVHFFRLSRLHSGSAEKTKSEKNERKRN